MFINKLIERFHNSKAAKFLSDSFLFENIDDISFLLLILTIISTAFMPSGTIGLLALFFTISCVFKMFVKKGEAAELSFLNKVLIVYFLFVVISLFVSSLFILSLKGILKTIIYEFSLNFLQQIMSVSFSNYTLDHVYDYKFVGLSHNTVRGAAGGAVLCAELLKAQGYITAK